MGMQRMRSHPNAEKLGIIQAKIIKIWAKYTATVHLHAMRLCLFSELRQNGQNGHYFAVDLVIILPLIWLLFFNPCLPFFFAPDGKINTALE